MLLYATHTESVKRHLVIFDYYIHLILVCGFIRNIN